MEVKKKMKKANKVVIIGGPSSGKTSLIEELEQRGYQVMHEVAREIFEERAHHELNQAEWETRQRLIYQKQVLEEGKYSGLVFLDRGVLDSIAYSEHHLGYVPFDVVDQKYDMVFDLERLPFVEDGLRTEKGDDEAQEIHDRILKAYTSHGYSLNSIPAFKAPTVEESVSKRADCLLSKLEGIIT